jgi:hypothetical protein
MKTTLTNRLLISAALLLAFTRVAPAVPVTFQVNLEVQVGLGTFNPAAHTVEVHGAFDGWGPGVTLTPSATNANVYEGTVDLAGAPGSQVQYKFVINQAGLLVWEGNVGPGGAQNRSLNLPAAAEILPVVFFNNQSAPPGVVPVTFQVNMEIQRAIGNFDPETHTVEVHGAFDSWGPGITLAASPTHADIYQGTVNITGSPGTVFEHKFVINKAGTQFWEGNVGPGGPFGNRTFALAASDQLLPIVFFNNLTNHPGTGTRVTFRVNLDVAIARGTFDPASGTVTVAGEFNNWSPTATPLTNSPTEPSLYVGTLNITSASPGGSVPFKFVLNGGTWEGGDNRAFTLAASDQVLPVEYFDRVSNLGSLTLSLNPRPFEVEVTVSWTGGPRVWLQSTTNLTQSAWQDVPDTLGQTSVTLLYGSEELPTSGRFFRAVGP